MQKRPQGQKKLVTLITLQNALDGSYGGRGGEGILGGAVKHECERGGYSRE